jgi:hypothetical protein
MRNQLALSLAAGLLGGGLILFGADQPWGNPGPPVPTVSGQDVNPVGSLVSSLGAVVLLGAIVVAVTRTVGRRLAGLVVLLAAAATAYVTVTAAGTWSGWRVAVLAGAILGVVGGGLAAVRGHRWAGMSSRYDAPSTPPPAHESDPWKALDRGDDPTL